MAANATSPLPAQLPDVSSMQDILDIKPPMLLDEGVPPWVWALLAAAILAAAGYLLYRKLRGRKNAAAAPPTPPHERALADLAELENTPEMGPKPFYFRLTAVMRLYLEERYGFPAMEMTTEELLPRLSKLSLPPELRQGIKDLSLRADPVKYASMAAGPDAMREDAAFVRTLVVRTIPSHDPNKQKPDGQERNGREQGAVAAGEPGHV